MNYRTEEIIFTYVLSSVGVFLLWFLSFLPFLLKAQASCLENGYPKATIAWNYKTYCMNLDGDVVGKVVATDKMKEEK